MVFFCVCWCVRLINLYDEFYLSAFVAKIVIEKASVHQKKNNNNLQYRWNGETQGCVVSTIMISPMCVLRAEYPKLDDLSFPCEDRLKETRGVKFKSCGNCAVRKKKKREKDARGELVSMSLLELSRRCAVVLVRCTVSQWNASPQLVCSPLPKKGSLNFRLMTS